MLLLCGLLFVCQLIRANTLIFTDDFKFGVATASYQIEGAWNENGKGENIWDRLTHEHPEKIADKSNGDIACDAYHKTDEDIENLVWLGVDFYRFSLSWSRLLPSGFTNEINKDGVRYYNELIDKLLAHNITPMVTLYHWDLPQPLQEAGGWPNEILAQYFEDYARTAFKLFGDRVRTWITFNEPLQVCEEGYGLGTNAPMYYSDGIASYLCGRTLLLSHARAYRLYYSEFKQKQQGKVGITINGHWFEPATNSSKDKEAAETVLQMTFGWWSHPIFSKEGDFPKVMKDRISKISKDENFPRSRLPSFTKEEIQLIQGTSDFFGLNHYTSSMASSNTSTCKWKTPSFVKDIGVNTYYDPSWPGSAAPWLKVVPWGFRKLLQWIKKEYNNPTVYITENGYADRGELQDKDRISYYTTYFAALKDAIEIDGCNVKGYAAWSLMDNFEWLQGYTQRFGLFYVNITSPNRTRIAKDSAGFYKNIIKTKIFTVPNVEMINT